MINISMSARALVAARAVDPQVSTAPLSAAGDVALAAQQPAQRPPLRTRADAHLAHDEQR